MRLAIVEDVRSIQGRRQNKFTKEGVSGLVFRVFDMARV